MNTHVRSMPRCMCVAALAPVSHVCMSEQDITLLGLTQPFSKFVETIARLLQKHKMRVARHLQVRVEEHQMPPRAHQASEIDERHAEHGMSQTSVAWSLEQNRVRSIALAAARKDALYMLMYAVARQPDSGSKTLEAFLGGHWQFQSTTCGGFSCVCCVRAGVIDIHEVASPPRASSALVQGTYGMEMRMRTPRLNTWQTELLERNFGSSGVTT